MVRSLLGRLFGRSSGDEADADAESDDEGGFTPSRLDASVLYAHGMGATGVEWELTSLEHKGEMLEEEQRER